MSAASTERQMIELNASPLVLRFEYEAFPTFAFRFEFCGKIRIASILIVRVESNG